VESGLFTYNLACRDAPRKTARVSSLAVPVSSPALPVLSLYVPAHVLAVPPLNTLDGDYPLDDCVPDSFGILSFHGLHHSIRVEAKDNPEPRKHSGAVTETIEQ